MASTDPSSAETRRPLFKRPIVLMGLAVIAVVVVVGLWAFQPWKEFTSSEVDEAIPTAAAGNGGDAEPGAQGGAEPTVLAEGEFVSHAHETTGTARIIELEDGSRFLRFENLAGSDGPDLKVWLTDTPADDENADVNNSRYVELGDLTATHGNQNYEIPAHADIAGLTSVVIWCDRFNVAFGAAPLAL